MVLLTTDQTAKELGVSISAVRAMCQDGRLAGVNTGTTPRRAYWRIPQSEVRRLKHEGTNGHHASNGNGHAPQPAPRALPLAEPQIPDGWLTVKDAAKRFGRSLQGVSALALHGRVQNVKVPAPTPVGYAYYINPATMPEKWRRVPATVPVAATPAAPTVAGPDRFTVMAAKLDQIAARLDAVATDVAALVRAWNG